MEVDERLPWEHVSGAGCLHLMLGDLESSVLTPTCV